MFTHHTRDWSNAHAHVRVVWILLNDLNPYFTTSNVYVQLLLYLSFFGGTVQSKLNDWRVDCCIVPSLVFTGTLDERCGCDFPRGDRYHLNSIPSSFFKSASSRVALLPIDDLLYIHPPSSSSPVVIVALPYSSFGLLQCASHLLPKVQLLFPLIHGAAHDIPSFRL